MKLYVGIDVNEKDVCLVALDENNRLVLSRCENSEDEPLLAFKKVFSGLKDKLGLTDDDIVSAALVSEDPLLKLALGADAVVSRIVSKKAFDRLKEEGALFSDEVNGYDGYQRAAGAAIIGKDTVQNSGEKTKFYGFKLIDDTFKSEKFTCGGCGTCCDVTRLKVNDETVGFAGDSCGKWRSSLIKKKMVQEFVSDMVHV